MRLLRPRMLTALAALAACHSAVVPPPDPAQLVVLKQAPAITTPGSTIAEISVRLLSATGDPVPDRLVEWSGDGDLTPNNSRTDDLGIATAVWELPHYPEWSFRPHGPSGTHRAFATSTGLPTVEFTTTTRAFRVDQFDAAFDYGCGVHEGELWCWGRDPFELPRTGHYSRPSQVALPTGTVATEVGLTDIHMCYLDQDGAARCFSYGTDAIVDIQGLPPVRAITAGSTIFQEAQFCALDRADSSAWCWTFDDAGPTTARRVSPLPFAALAVSVSFACGLTLDGAAWCWGNNAEGQLGNASRVSSEAPVPVSGAHAFQSLSAGGVGACGTTAAREVWCWGGRGPLAAASDVPLHVTLPGVEGDRVYVSGFGDGYVIDEGHLTVWFSNTTLPIFATIDRMTVHRVAGDGQMCVQTVTMELFCSWILLIGGGDTSPFPSDLLPVPDPASPDSP